MKIRLFLALIFPTLGLLVSACVKHGSSGEEIAQQPIPISGKPLVNVDEARARCFFKHLGEKTYEVVCRAVVLSEAIEVPALSTTLDLSWSDLRHINGNTIESNSCSTAEDRLSRTCVVKLIQANVAATVEMVLTALDPHTGQTRVEPERIDLPFGVESYGFVAAAPRSFRLIQQAGETFTQSAPAIAGRRGIVASPGTVAPTNPALVDLGYEAQSKPATDVSLINPSSACLLKDRLLVAASNYIFSVKEGQLTPFAGSVNEGQAANYSDLNRLRFGAGLKLHCVAEDVYVVDTTYGRVLKLSASKKPQVIALSNENFADPANDIAARVPRFPRVITSDGAGNFYLVTSPARIWKLSLNESGRYVANLFAEGTTNIEKIAVSPTGEVYFSDGYHVKRVMPDGTVSEVLDAGTSVAGLGFDANGFLYTNTSQAFQGSPSRRAIIKIAPQADGSFVTETVVDSLVDTVAELGPQGERTVIPYPAIRWFVVSADGSVYGSRLHSNSVQKYFPGESGTWLFSRVAGSQPILGTALAGDGGPAELAELNRPTGSAVLEDGSLLIADLANSRVRRVHQVGQAKHLTTFVGPPAGVSGLRGQAIEGALASEVGIESPSSVAVAKDGTIYVSQSGGAFSILKVAKQEGQYRVSTFIGGMAGFAGDGGPVSEARVRAPMGLHFSADGALYFADKANHRIRKVVWDTSGNATINTVAGNDVGAPQGDGGPAVEALLGSPVAVATDLQGNFYIVESTTYRVRKVNAQGIITTIAGTGTQGKGAFAEGSPALNVEFHQPNGIGVDPSGVIYVSDEGAERVVRLNPAEGGYAASLFLSSSRNTPDCAPAGARAAGAGDLSTSLAVSCFGRPLGLNLYAACQGPAPKMRLLVPHSFDSNSPLAVMMDLTIPCP